MTHPIYTRRPVFQVDLPAFKAPPTEPPVTKAATIRTIEPSSMVVPEVAIGNIIPRFLRLRQIIAPHGPIPVSKNTWLAWVDSKHAPAPHQLSPRIRVWLESDIVAFISNKLTKKEI